jgi:hypothetical protein
VERGGIKGPRNWRCRGLCRGCQAGISHSFICSRHAIWHPGAGPELLDRQRRLTNTEYIQKENKERQEETDLAKRAAGMDFMQLLARDDDMCLGFLKRWTMIDSLDYANSIT